MKQLIGMTVLLAFLIGTTGCFVRGGRHHGVGVGPAFLAAAIIGTAIVAAQHDAHQHHQHCGCERRHHGGHWVYFYGGHWEYFDKHQGHWYTYED